ncbi:MAG: ATP-grasp domain-containing protein [Nostoc sp.]|uniref:ATP-grasp domain-containing protein n=1 Tax=Nostoc sp. TaxID=1180 RepID=UPI002FF9EE58
MSLKNIIVIHRWPDNFVDYDNFIDSNKYLVHYIVNSSGKRGINAESNLVGSLFELGDLTQIDALIKCTEEIIAKFGKIEKIIAPSESDLIIAANLRTKFTVPGIQESQVQFFRDKVAMKTKVKQGGVTVPEFIDCEDEIKTLKFAEKIGYPVILKPKDGSGSEGVNLLHNQEGLAIFLKKINIANYECEQFIPGTIFHVDGLVSHQEIIFSSVSKYLNTCLDFNDGKALGSVMIDDELLRKKIVEFTQKVLATLELNNSAFHLEIILKDELEPVFLEIGARVGGGGIPFLHKDIYEINLVQDWMKMELEDFSGLHQTNESIIGGFLMMPEPRETPCKVLKCKELKGTITTLYKEVLPEAGEILDGEGGYNHISGTFFYKSNCSQEIIADINKTINYFEIKYEKVEI